MDVDDGIYSFDRADLGMIVSMKRPFIPFKLDIL
jgi:hypothetical protein